MKKYNIIVDDQIVMTVEAGLESTARQAARKAGFHFCQVKEVKEITIPGENEYKKYLSWKTKPAQERENRDFFLEIAIGSDEKETVSPWPLTEEETERAEGYAKFLGETIYRDFIIDLDNAKR